MSRLSILLSATLLYACFYLQAQSAQPTPQDINVQISTVQVWTDTGIDFKEGDTLEITPATSPEMPCAATGKVSSSTQDVNLPLPSAPAGSLIARLNPQTESIFAVGKVTKLTVQEPSHLFLGWNVSKVPACQATASVKVRRTPASSADASASPNRKDQLKSQLLNAAQVFMSGQFGVGKTDSSASNVASNATSGEAVTSPEPSALKISDTSLDASLRKLLDGLPRRVNDQFNNLGDMVNFVIVGSQKNVQAVLEAATWHVADTDNRKAILNAVLQTYDNKDYLAMPMSTLYLFGRKQDFGYEMAEPIAMVASRHHFRIWKAGSAWNGQEVWVGAGTHDIGFARDKRNNNVTHKIDPAVDGERDNIGISIQKTNKAKTFSYYLPPNPVQEAKNATGDGYHSDGRILVILLN